ncbi:MAG TPA: hypothetical protein DIU15_03775 [Deltaproteobacteria bacterium]|nr:hypothetical protein [Deltaproteobacteria bacterium]
MVEDADSAAELLAPLLEKDVEALKARLTRSNTRFVWLSRQLPVTLSKAIRELDIPGVRLTAEATREYPSGGLAASVLGFVGTDGHGLEGLESRNNKTLTGDTFRYQVFRDGRRRAVNHAAVLARRSTEGDNLVLTLDHSIQHRAEQALAEALERGQARAGWVVTLDAKTGAVLAMASAPGFDPNRFGAYERSRWKNRNLGEIFEPGSTMKPFVIAEVLDKGLATPDEKVYCEKGRFRVGRRIIHDTHAYDMLTVGEVLKVSSNICSMKLGERLGPAGLEAAYRRFGFGAKTGVDLSGEQVGILHDSAKWSRIGFANQTFGQGLAVTGIQLAAAFATLVNGGLKVTPHVVAEVRSQNQEVLEDRRPDGPGERVITEETSAIIRDMLSQVVQRGGTAPLARLDDYSSGGKTGTAQKVADGRYAKDLYVSSFVGFAPVDDPRVVTFVVVDEPTNKGNAHFGGKAAGPAFKEVTTHALRVLGVAPDLEAKSSVVVANRRAAPRDVAEAQGGSAESLAERLQMLAVTLMEGEMPDLRGLSLRDAVVVLTSGSMSLEHEGSGLVATQDPLPGQVVEPGAVIRVALALGQGRKTSRR